MSVGTDIMTCRCRHCGTTFPYLRSDAGAQAECPDCRNSVLLPGKLQGLATKRTRRKSTVPTLMMEVGGFLLMFVLFPYGMILGIVLVAIGWKNSSVLQCSNCEAPTNKESTRCGKCRAAFSSD